MSELTPRPGTTTTHLTPATPVSVPVRAFHLPSSRFAATAAQAAVGIAHQTLEQEWLWVNQRWCEIVGWPREELMRMRLADITHPDDIEVSEEMAGLATLGEVPEYAIEKRYRRKDGSYVWTSLTVSVIRAPGGAPSFFVGFLQDISARKRAEEELRQSEERYRQLSEAAVEGILIHDNGIIMDANPAFCRLLGYTLDELRGVSVFESILTPEAVETAKRNLAAGTTIPYEIEVRHKDGHIMPVEITGRHTWCFGKKMRVVVARDLTERKLAEAQALQLAREQAARAAREEMLGIVAHDLRNPLGTMHMAAELLMESIPPEQTLQRKQLDIMMRAGERMNRLIQDLLDVKRIEAGTFTVSPGPESAAIIVAEALDQLRPHAARAGLTIDMACEEDLPSVYADAARIQQLLGNLVGNAIKFTPRGGEIIVQAERCEDGMVRFAVTDSGPGIPEDKLPHVFGRFWQAHPGDRRGIGLGLAIAKAIVDGHGGRIWAVSTVGVGTTFYFTLPAAVIPHERA